MKFLHPILIILTIYLSRVKSTSAAQFAATWSTYRWIQSQKSLFQPSTQSAIQLSHPQVPYMYISVDVGQSIKLAYHCYNVSEYSAGNGGVVRVIGVGQWAQIYMENVKQVSIQFKCLKQSCMTEKQYVENMLKENRQLMENCRIQDGKYNCQLNNTFTFDFSLSNHHKRESTPSTTPLQTLLEYCRQSTQNLMKIYSINPEPIKQQITKQAINALISSICLSKYQNNFYLGFCEQSRTKKWHYNYKLAPFSTYILADFDYKLAEHIYRDLFDLLAAKWMYPTERDELEVLPIPEHVQIFNRFGNVLQLQKQVQLLNSFFVTPMLSQLGTLHEQLNYREAKKFHPLLLKMLQQKWSSTTALHSLKSLYQQSFTQDFKYHSYGEQLDQSTAKCSWLYKVIDMYTGMLIKHHAFYMPAQQIKQHLQEHFTLLNIMRVYANDDSYSKTGKYKDIVNVGENLKIYGNYSGYQSVLPYVYGLGKVYPAETIKQLETSYGLKSSNQQQHQQYQKKYRYRGDIHTYFNLKILTGLQYRINEDKSMPAQKRLQIQTSLNKTLAAVGNKVIKDYKQNKQIYTSWTAEGKGKQRTPWGKIVSALFLKWV